MQEWCPCGAAFKTRNYRRLSLWRTDHRHDPQQEPEPQPQGSFSQAELSHQDDFLEDSEIARIGFQPN